MQWTEPSEFPVLRLLGQTGFDLHPILLERKRASSLVAPRMTSVRAASDESFPRQRRNSHIESSRVCGPAPQADVLQLLTPVHDGRFVQ